MNETPIRQQYLNIKRQYPQAIVLFRLGDFYETFDEDANITAKELEIVLTSREMGKGNKVPMAGIPYHALDNYLGRLISRGYRVAICDQLTRPGDTRGIVQRDVVRVVTPGTVVEPELLNSKTNNYLVALVFDQAAAGIAYVDITTGEFATTQLPPERVSPELERLKPSEIIIPKSLDAAGLNFAAPVARLDDSLFETEGTRQKLLDHFGVATLDGYGCAGLPLAIQAAGAIIQYLTETQRAVLGQLTQLSTYSTTVYMALDAQTQRNLEIFQNARSSSTVGSLLSVIDLTRTAMGGRLLKKWLSQPSLSIGELKKRQAGIDWFVNNALARVQTVAILGKIADLERLINRTRSYTVLPRELVLLQRSLQMIPQLKAAINNPGLADSLKPCPEAVALIEHAIEVEPTLLGDGGVIKTGFASDLDSLRQSSKNAKQYLADLERHERARTGIKSLKVSYNKVFGYYIEVSQANLAQVPQQYIRKQTLVGGERYITPELKEYETLILNARDRISEIETNLFRQVCGQLANYAEAVLFLAQALANIDLVSSLAEVAVRYNYVKPELTNSNEITISQGRHPVVERNLPPGVFIANDTLLSNDDHQLIILTGPNMSGKSTYLRQVALIVLLAQIGSFVPAASARIGLVDRIFTRVGAGEDIAAGQSTFMVEMVETANILNNATAHSLIILDEIGRGTSTYDGLSIAQAVVEYIHNQPRLGAKTLFATHYHELVGLAGFLPRVKNYNVAVAEEIGKVIFLYKIVPGGVDRSYGIHVAQLAGLPKAVIHRANEVLTELEFNSREPAPQLANKKKAEANQIQLPLLDQRHPVLDDLANLEINSLTPLEALTQLYHLQQKAKE